jgi:porin-like protein
MKMIKSLILGSAAALVTIGAHAADLPVKAKAVEYVKTCTLYGAGFYYIPGTDTCIKLGGYLRVDAILNGSGDYDAARSGVTGAQNRLSNYFYTRSRAKLQVDTRTATEYGVVRTFAELVYNWTSGTYSGAGTGLTGGATTYEAGATNNGSAGGLSGGTLGVYFAFIQFAGFTMGKTISQFSAPWTNYPANNFDGLPGGGGDVTGVNQFSYTAQFGNGVSLSLSAQDPSAYYTTNVWNVSGATAAGLATGAYGAGDIGGTRSPDFVAMVRVDQPWGLFQASFAAHDNHAGYYGASEVTGFPADKWGWAGQLALSIKNIPTGPGDSINMSGVYTNGASRYNFQDGMSSTFAMYGSTGLAGAYQSLGIGGVSDSVFVAGSGQQLTTTYGFQGGYNHNWNPNWVTSIYGAWAAVRYNDTAKGYICNAMTSVLALAGSCNPDFNYAVVGTKTDWTPVKNLTFSADLAYVMLDQKYSGTVTLPAQAGIAKPGAAYQLKDQNTVTLLLRAQRNW